MLFKTLSPLLLLASLSQVLCSPANKHRLERRADWDRANSFLGINWEYAADTCTDAQLDILIEATRKSQEYQDYPWYHHSGQDSTDPYINTLNAAWSYYFYSSFQDNDCVNESWLHNNTLSDVFENIILNLNIARTYPYYGDPGGKYMKKSRRVAYRCKGEGTTVNHCAINPRILAYTETPQKAESGIWTITFCPAYFNNLRYLNDLTESGTKQPQDLYTLISYEQALVHEFMHVALFGYNTPINDLYDWRMPSGGNGVDVPVYGWDRCHEYAWLFTSDVTNPSTTSVNPNVVMNADNYAWYLTAFWFQTQFNWDFTEGCGSVWPGVSTSRKMEARDYDETPDAWGDDFDATASTLDINTIVTEFPAGCPTAQLTVDGISVPPCSVPPASATDLSDDAYTSPTGDPTTVTSVVDVVPVAAPT